MNDHNNANLSYSGPREDLLSLLPIVCCNVLDIGCNTGLLGASIKERQPARVTGAEVDSAAAAKAAEQIDEVYVGDVENEYFRQRFAGRQFDAVICGDVLEHLRDPWGLLNFLVTESTQPGAVFIVSLPNVGHWSTFYNVWLRQRWPLNNRGIHDRTHLRWFTVRDAVSLLKDNGLQIDVVRKKPRLIEAIHPWNGGWIERILYRFFGNLLVHQVLVRGRKLPC